MWTGGERPPALPAATPGDGAAPMTPAPNSATTGAFRPSQRQSELEELRAKGLAKLLNKHFTEVTKTLAAEKAAADAALRDLETRKAGTSEFEPSRQGELSPFDSLYVQLKQKRNECRRKERETLMLYQRYVHKFGSMGVVQVPAAAAPPSSTTKTNNTPPAGLSNPVLVPTMAQAIDSKVTELVQKGADRIPSYETLGIDKTYQTLHARDSWELQQFFRRQLEERGIDARCTVTTSPTTNPRRLFNGPRFPAPNLPQLTESPGSPESRGVAAIPWEYPYPGDNRPHAPLFSVTEDADDDDEHLQYHHNYHMSEGMGELEQHGDGAPHAVHFADRYIEGFDDYDDRSLVSGLTSVNSAATMLMHETETRLVEFLKTETEAIRQMLAEEDKSVVVKVGTTATASATGTEDHSHYSGEAGSHSSRAADKAENMVKQMQEILDAFQKDAVAKGEVVVPSRGPRRIETSNPDEEWVAYYDDTFQKEYYHEVHSNRTQWELPENTAIEVSETASTTTASVTDYAPQQQQHLHKAALLLSHEDVMPEVHVTTPGRRMSSRRELYVKKRRRQRNRRIVVFGMALTVLMGLAAVWKHHYPDITLEEVATHVVGDKVVQEAKAVKDMTVNVVNQVLETETVQRYYHIATTELHKIQTVSIHVISKVVDVEKVHRQVKWVATTVQDQVGLWRTGGETQHQQPAQQHQKRQQEKEHDKKPHRATKLVHRQSNKQSVRELEWLIMHESVNEKCNSQEDGKDEKQHHAGRQHVAKDRALHISEDDDDDILIDRFDYDDDDASDKAVALLEDEESMALEIARPRRPWLCNIPFAFLFHPRCWRLAHENPLFSVWNLVQKMMQ